MIGILRTRSDKTLALFGGGAAQWQHALQVIEVAEGTWFTDKSVNELEQYHPGKWRLKPSTFFGIDDSTLLRDWGVDLHNPSESQLWLQMLQAVISDSHQLSSEVVKRHPYQLFQHQRNAQTSRKHQAILAGLPPSFVTYSATAAAASSVWLYRYPNELFNELLLQRIPVGPYVLQHGSYHLKGQENTCFVEISIKAYSSARSVLQWLPERGGRTVWIAMPEYELISAMVRPFPISGQVISRRTQLLSSYLGLPPLQKHFELAPGSQIVLQALLIALLGRGHNTLNYTEQYLASVIRLSLLPATDALQRQGFTVTGLGAGRIAVCGTPVSGTGKLLSEYRLLSPACWEPSGGDFEDSPYGLLRQVLSTGQFIEISKLDSYAREASVA